MKKIIIGLVATALLASSACYAAEVKYFLYNEKNVDQKAITFAFKTDTGYQYVKVRPGFSDSLSLSAKARHVSLEEGLNTVANCPDSLNLYAELNNGVWVCKIYSNK